MAVIGAVPAASLRRKRCWRQRDERGQMTVELCIVFPVAIVIAVIAVNALLFFGQCSSFDRVARNAVRVIAASPPTKEASADLAARIEATVEAELQLDAGAVDCVRGAGCGRRRGSFPHHAFVRAHALWHGVAHADLGRPGAEAFTRNGIGAGQVCTGCAGDA